MSAIIVGSVSAFVLIVLSPTVWVDILKNEAAIFPMKNPAIFSMPLAFVVAWIVSLMTPDLEAQKKFDSELVRTYLGVGAE